MHKASLPQPRLFASTAAFLVAAPVYLSTANRTVGFVDRGELAAAACTLGIPHPTGYPTAMWLGWIASRFSPAHPVIGLNVAAAFMVAIGVGVLALLFDTWLAEIDAAEGARHPRVSLDTVASVRVRATVAGALALAVGFAPIWWEQANGFEVYALHAVLLPLVILLSLAYVREAAEVQTSTEHVSGFPPGDPEVDDGMHATVSHRRARLGLRGAGLGLVLGIALTNHLTTLLLLPALLAHALARLGARRMLLAIPRILPGLALGLLPYAWLPWRASQHPRFDWGDPETLTRFLHHVGGREYRGWMLQGGDVFLQQLGFFVRRVPGEIAWVGLPLAILGAGNLTRRHRPLGALAATMLVVSVAYAATYRIREIDAYFMAGVLALGLFAVTGIAALARRARPALAVAVALALAGVNLAVHYRECDESRNRLAADLTTNLIAPLPHTAVLFTSQWDYTLAPSEYFQAIEGLRPDVLVVSPPLTRSSWYLEELARRDSAFARAVAPEIERFTAAVTPFENDRPCDRDAIARAHTAMLAAMMDRARIGRPVFVTWELRASVPARRHVVPLGLAFRVDADEDSGYVPYGPPRFVWRPWAQRRDHWVATTSWIYGQALYERARYEALHGRVDRAESLRRLALSFAPGFAERDLGPLPYEGRDLAIQSLRFFEGLRRVDLAMAANRP